MKKKGSSQDKKYKSELEKRFLLYWKKTGIPIATQYPFHPTRQFRFDFAFPERKIAIEIQGYGMGHASYVSMAKDYERHNEATQLGWSIYYFMGIHIKEEAVHKTIDYLIKVLKGQPMNQTPQRETGAELLRRLRDGKKS
jgi:very-short-patch-repair endonuclease